MCSIHLDPSHCFNCGESESEVVHSCPTLSDPMDCSLFMGFSRQDYWSVLPFLSSGDLPNPGIEPGSPALQTHALPSEPPIVGGVFQKLYNKCLCLQHLPLFHLDSGLAVFNGEIKWESMQFCNMGTEFQSTHLGWKPLLELWGTLYFGLGSFYNLLI